MNFHIQPGKRPKDAVDADGSITRIPAVTAASQMAANDNDPDPGSPPPLPPAASSSVRRDHRGLPVAA